MVQVCEQAGTKVLQRYIQWRRLQQLMREISSHSVAKRSNAPAQAALAVDPRQVCVAPAPWFITEFLLRSGAILIALHLFVDVPLPPRMFCKTTRRSSIR